MERIGGRKRLSSGGGDVSFYCTGSAVLAQLSVMSDWLKSILEDADAPLSFKIAGFNSSSNCLDWSHFSWKSLFFSLQHHGFDSDTADYCQAVVIIYLSGLMEEFKLLKIR